MAVPFIGRSVEMARLAGLAGVTLVTLWGPGGVGKTRLAREHAAAERRRGRVVAWADLAASRTRHEVVTTIAAALGVALLGTEDDSASLARAAASQRALLILDNLEQIDAAARAAVAHLATGSAGACVLVTSRELLGVAHELAIPIAPLGEDDGVVLFDALSGSSPDEETTRAIVRRLDALPLAIELAAARVPLLGATELLARLDRKLDVLGGPTTERPARHATLRAAIAWSWDLLDAAERGAPFDAALAEAVIGGAEAEALDCMERLRKRALLHSSNDAPGRTTLRLLESVRDFVRRI